MSFGVSIENLIDKFAALPGIGRKSAQRLAFHVINMTSEDAESFAKTIIDAKEKIKYCKICQNLTDEEVCSICDNPSRDKEIICVVESPRDIAAFEKTREYKSVYHVLHGTISPLDGIGPDQLKIKELLARLNSGQVAEVIMATNPNPEGEVTAMYISKLLKPLNIKVTRLAYGIPIGAELECADEVTLLRALEGRNEL